MGFVNDIRFLMAKVPEQRQTLCFSATISRTIDMLIQDFLKHPITISTKISETPENIEQDVIRVKGGNKVDVLYDMLGQEDFKKVLVFGRTKRGVENLSRTLGRRGVKAESIHSDKSLAQRKRALLNFKHNRAQALVATDVAARGLDIDSVTHVINFELPATYDEYIHRIGRTGRGTSRGKALTFID
jgi:ATP-dependent RNA helicase RhlE